MAMGLARALAIGPAYSAISDDYAAVFFNPAGLGQIKRFEATLGFDFFDYSTNALYLNTSNAAAKSGNTLNSIGLVLPFPTYQGSFVVAVGYNRLQNFRAVQNVSAFNPSGSISDWFLSFTPRFDAQQRILLTDVGALAFNHYLMSDRNGQYVDPLINRGQVFQRSDLLEDGGSNAFSISAAIEVAPALFIGATLNIISSYYTFSRDFSEHDDNNVYPNFISLTLSESFETRTSGANLKAGLLYRPDSHWRLGLTLQIPSQLSLKDEFNTSLQTRYERPPEGLLVPSSTMRFPKAHLNISCKLLGYLAPASRLRNHFLLSAPRSVTVIGLNFLTVAMRFHLRTSIALLLRSSKGRSVLHLGLNCDHHFCPCVCAPVTGLNSLHFSIA